MFISKRFNYGKLGALDQVFEDFFGKNVFNTVAFDHFNHIVLEKDSEAESVLAIDLPDFDQEEVSVTVKNEVLYIKAKNERRSKSASTYLPKEKYESENINAKLKNGVLRITVPKKTKETLKQLEIKIE